MDKRQRFSDFNTDVALYPEQAFPHAVWLPGILRSESTDITGASGICRFQALANVQVISISGGSRINSLDYFWSFDAYPPEMKVTVVLHYSQMNQSRLNYGQCCVHFASENRKITSGGSRIDYTDYHWFSVNGQEESYLILHYFSHSTMSVPRKSCGQCSSLMVTKESVNTAGGSRINSLDSVYLLDTWLGPNVHVVEHYSLMSASRRNYGQASKHFGPEITKSTAGGSRPTDIINTYALSEAGSVACIVEHHSLMIHSRKGYGQGSKHFNLKTSTNTFGGSRIIDLQPTSRTNVH